MKNVVLKILLFTLIAALALPLYSCGDDSNTIVVCNWGEYICDDEEFMDVIAEFERRTGINVVYTTAETNESLYALMKAGSVNYDVIFPSDYMIEKMISENMLKQLNFDNIPNFSNISETFVNPYYDPQNQYSVPYFWGTVGIVYNSKLVTEEITGWDILWSSNYKNQIMMFNNPRDAFAIALNKLGYSMNTTNEDEIREAAEELKKQVWVFGMDEFFEKMPSESAVLAPYYAGDYLTVAAENPDLKFYRPESGTNIFNDAMCIPATSTKQELAEKFINFMLEADVGKANTEYLGYSTPNNAVLELLDDDIKNDDVAYPEIKENWEYFRKLPENIEQLMQELWIEIKNENK